MTTAAGPPHQRDEAPHRASWHRPSDWRVRTKLAAVMTVPAIVVLVLSGLRMSTQLQEQATLATAQQGLRAGSSALAVADALQHERDTVVAFISGRRADTSRLAESVQSVDRAVLMFMDAAGRPDLDDQVRNTGRRALNELAGLDALRASVLQTRYPAVVALRRYSQILDVVAQVNRVSANGVSNLPFGGRAGAVRALADMQEQLTVQNAILHGAANSRDLPPQSASDLRSAVSRFDAAHTVFITDADPRLRQRFQDVVTGPDIDGRNRLVEQALVESAADKPVTIPPAEVARIGDAATDLVRTVRRNIEQDVADTVDDLAQRAHESLLRDQALVITGLAIAIAMTLWMTRLLIRPLRTLRRSALAVATQGLPNAVGKILADPNPTLTRAVVADVPVHTREEVGQVARAFDAVHGEAIRLATAQAVLRRKFSDMIVNLARRTQALVERQLAALDGLEAQEADPDQLASLFQLDSLAARMRRNCENLLVLSDTRTPRRGTKPMPLAEVLGAALSEVEQYRRVEITAGPDVAVHPHAAHDLVHLIAELLDNATAYSKPDTPVTVRSAIDPRGDLKVQVRDYGIGFTKAKLAEVNASLAESPQVDAAVAHQMGLFVVAKLAARFGIKVRLLANEDFGDGTRAQVVVPCELVVGDRSDLAELDGALAMPAAVGAAMVTHPHLRVENLDTVAPVPDPVPSPPWRPARRRHIAASTSQLPLGTLQLPDQIAAEENGPSTDRFEACQAVVSEWFQTATPITTTAEDDTSDADGSGPPHRSMPKDAASGAHERTEVLSAVPRLTPLHRRPRDDWASPADDTWQNARVRLRAQVVEGTTGDQLPKRTPNAHLLPGSLVPTQEDRQRPPKPPRTAEAMREQLRTYQAAVERGRHAAVPSGRLGNDSNAHEETA